MKTLTGSQLPNRAPFRDSHQINVVQHSIWPRWQLIGFRFAFCYLVLYIFPFPIGSPVFGERVEAFYEELWHKSVPWVAAHFLRLSYPITIFTNGSGDTTYDYVKVLCFGVIALAATVLWSVLDRKRNNYAKMHYWLRLYVRVMLACTILIYAADKVAPAQMPAPELSALIQPFGDFTPFSLLWSFVGASRGFEVFAGTVELSAGILLLIPGLTTLGALVALGAMTNVFVLNLFYDTPVKLFSLHLLALAGFLLLPNLRRLIDFFVLNRPTQSESRPPLFRRRFLNYGLWGIQWTLGLSIFIMMLIGASRQVHRLDNLSSSNALYGIWKVQEFTMDGQVLPPLLSDDQRWQRVIFDYPGVVTIQKMNGDFTSYANKVDSNKSTISVKGLPNADATSEFSYHRLDSQSMLIEGRLSGRQVHATLHKEARSFILKTRGFHWINERPFS